MHSLFLYLGLLLFFLALSVFFSGSETAFTAVNRLRLKYLAETGDAKAGQVQKIVGNPDKLLGVILLGNNIANIGAATLVTYIATTFAFGDPETNSLAASVALTLFILIFCELTPKLIAATQSELVTRKLVWPVRASIFLLSPFARLAAVCAAAMVRLTGLSTSVSPFAHALSEEEIRSIIAGAGGSGIAEERRKMLRNVFDMGATQVRGVMIPRTEVTAVDIDDPLEEIIALIGKTNYSRIPVYRGSFDNIQGILYVKDMLQFLRDPDSIRLQVLLRPVQFIPDTANAESVLKQLQSMHLHMAVVVDEFGGVEGIVTLEDLLEEIVGEIRDEHDVEVEAVRPLGHELFSVAGNLPVRDFNRMFNSPIPDSREYATVAGFLQALTGRLLHEGESIRYQNLTFFIEKVEGFKILSIRVRVPAPKDEPVLPGVPAST